MLLTKKKIIVLLFSFVFYLGFPLNTKATNTIINTNNTTTINLNPIGEPVTLNPGGGSPNTFINFNPIGEPVTLSPGGGSPNALDNIDNSNDWIIYLNPRLLEHNIYIKEIYLYFIDKNGNEHKGTINRFVYKGIELSPSAISSYSLILSLCDLPPYIIQPFSPSCPDSKTDAAKIYITPPGVPIQDISQVGLFLDIESDRNSGDIRIGIISKGGVFVVPNIIPLWFYGGITNPYAGLSYFLKGFFSSSVVGNHFTYKYIFFINPNLSFTITGNTGTAGNTSSEPTTSTESEPITEPAVETPQIDSFARDRILQVIDNLLAANNDFSKTKYYNRFISYTRRLLSTLQSAKDKINLGGDTCSQRINIIIKTLDSIISFIEKRICVSTRPTAITQAVCKSASDFLSVLKESKDTINSTLQIDNNEDGTADACQVSSQ